MTSYKKQLFECVKALSIKYSVLPPEQTVECEHNMSDILVTANQSVVLNCDTN